MAKDKIVTCLLLGMLVTALKPIKAANIYCPRNCHCSSDYIAVKCRGLDKFPVLQQATAVRSLDLSGSHIRDIDKKELKIYENLKHLDIRYNEMKSVSPGLFSEMESLRELYIDNNPWSCDESTLHVLQMELKALARQNSHLENFDGGKIECFDPPYMKGTKPLHMINPMTKLYHLTKLVKGNKADDHQAIADGVLAVSIILVMLLLGTICGTAWVFRENLLHLIRNVWGLKPMEDGELGNKRILIGSMKKRRRMSKGLPASATSSTSSVENAEGGVGDSTVKLEGHGKLDNKKILIDVKKKRQHWSQGLAASAKKNTSSLTEVHEGVGDSADKSESHGELESNSALIERLKKRRHTSQGLPASAKSSTSSLEEGDGGVGDSADKLESCGKLESNSALIESLKKRRHTSQGLPASAKSSTSSLEELYGGVGDSTHKSESRANLESNTVLIESLKKRRHTSQGLPASAKSSTSSIEDVEGREVDSTGKSELGHGQLDSEGNLIDSMKTQHISWDLPASSSISTSSLEDLNEGIVDSVHNMENHSQLTVLINSVQKSQDMSQDIPAPETSGMSSSEDEVDLMYQHCVTAKEDD